VSANNLESNSDVTRLPDIVLARGTITPEFYPSTAPERAKMEEDDSSINDIEIVNVTITSEVLMPDLDMNIAATIHEQVRNPLYNMYKKSSKAFAFFILNLVILGWLNVFPLIVIMPAITGSTMLLLIFLDEMRVRKFVEKKII